MQTEKPARELPFVISGSRKGTGLRDMLARFDAELSAQGRAFYVDRTMERKHEVVLFGSIGPRVGAGAGAQ
jgi:hypothetical protein